MGLIAGEKIKYVWIGLNLVAALVPFLIAKGVPQDEPASFDRWPSEFQGKQLTRLDLTEREKRYSRNFPGHIARFTDGSREIVIRWLKKETRRLHPIADCLRGDGYSVKPMPMRLDVDGNGWGCVRARRDGHGLDVCEIIRDERGRTWSDVSSWYWAAILKRTKGPWWAITVAGDAQSHES